MKNASTNYYSILDPNPTSVKLKDQPKSTNMDHHHGNLSSIKTRPEHHEPARSSDATQASSATSSGSSHSDATKAVTQRKPASTAELVASANGNEAQATPPKAAPLSQFPQTRKDVLQNNVRCSNIDKMRVYIGDLLYECELLRNEVTVLSGMVEDMQDKVEECVSLTGQVAALNDTVTDIKTEIEFMHISNDATRKELRELREEFSSALRAAIAARKADWMIGGVFVMIYSMILGFVCLVWKGM
ncbi:hypothetical protein BJ508DRAFT_305256 [Ascobolus immersus RN42]|uniref:Uncharacterized protein n=1 Tax=Ascobolus immersus RN42 TaxID=1160509 RepID=A0A3N4IN02_ASCIM|nr:hypothetical protein BJ508DRAFT_305256 [Ascobolus immersus RN42]